MSDLVAKSSPIARAVVPRLSDDHEHGHLGAIVLRGHLLAVDACGVPATTQVQKQGAKRGVMVTVDDEHTNPAWRLFDDTFTKFLHFEREALLHHQPGDQTDQCCATGIVWIRYEAKILQGTTGEAYSLVGSGDGGWHKTGGGWHPTGGGWHPTGGGWSGDPGDWHSTGGGWHPTGGG
jgi:hypothetical protein